LHAGGSIEAHRRIGRKAIAQYVQRFRQVLPDATLTISNHVSTTLQEQMGAGRLDFAIAYDPAPARELDITPCAKPDRACGIVELTQALNAAPVNV
jgi:DNA-binding transcriptional LysR family regulator